MILQSILLVLEVITSFLLISVILLQKSKGGGLGGSAFGGGGGDSVFGARAGNVLTKITIGLAIFFLGNTLLLAFLFAGEKDASLMEQSAGASVEVRDVVPTPPPGDAAPVVLPPSETDAVLALPETSPEDAGSPPVVLQLPEEAPAEISEDPADL